MQITREQIGIILVVIGTLLLAFSVKVRRKYSNGPKKVVNNAKRKNPGLFEPTEASIIRLLFWFGLLFIVVGSAFQW